MDKNISAFSLTNPCKNEGKKEGSTFHIVLMVVFFVLTMVLIAAIWYRYRFIQDGNPPFSVPGFLPSWLFPREVNQEVDVSNQTT